MWIRLGSSDQRLIVHYVGVLVIGIGLAMSVPLVTGIVWGEWAAVTDYLLGMGVTCTIGALMMNVETRPDRLRQTHALIITALGWLVASMVAAIPLALSGNYLSYIDALFDAMSGLTTSGLTVAQDLDHMAHAHNMWRHLTHLIGGQGIVVAALSLSVGLRSGGFSLYLAEGRDERILPNVIHTVRFIWFVTATYIALGTLALLAVTTYLGMDPGRAVLHSFWAAVATYDTGGFGPQSMNAMYYHNFLFETVTIFLMIAGSLNFNLHAQVWRGDRRELWQSIEVRVLASSVAALSAVTAIGFATTHTLEAPFAAIRKGVYHVFSAHSGAGHQTLYGSQWLADVGGAGFAAILIAMAAGGAVSSTAGGIKALRLGVIGKALLQQVREALAPQSAVMRARYHHLGERLLTPETVSASAMVFIMYMITYVTGAVIGANYGYDLGEAAFESISATANVGLSTGITSAAMPTGLKLTYMAQMWAGRLEFLAVLVLAAHIITSLAGGRPKR
ncbi:MAG: TrkH family potassium uptake protein [Clostridiales bacterium]|nr:TrkH family potassium uptake protein [Clostridiales bacterium]